jgi:hypothetical protein
MPRKDDTAKNPWRPDSEHLTNAAQTDEKTVSRRNRNVADVAMGNSVRQVTVIRSSTAFRMSFAAGSLVGYFGDAGGA